MGNLLLVMSKARPGAEAAYLDWYRTRHLTDMIAVPGVAGGAVLRLHAEEPAPRWGVAALYEVTGPVSDILADVFGRAGSEAMPLTDTIDGASVLMLAAEPIAPRRLARPDADCGDALYYIVLTNSTAGEDAAFNAWYDGRHLDDVLAIPGFVAAQRFRLAAETAGKPSPWGYLALYELAPETAETAMSDLQARAGSVAMPLSPALDTASVYARLFAPARVLPA